MTEQHWLEELVKESSPKEAIIFLLEALAAPAEERKDDLITVVSCLSEGNLVRFMREISHITDGFSSVSFHT